MGLLSRIYYRVRNTILFYFIIILLPGLPPRTTFPFRSFDIAAPRELTGALAPNFHLENAERLLEGRVYGPECLIARGNEVYTGIHGGEVIKITADHITHVTKIGQPCEEIFEEARCGRPLGLAFDTLGDNLLIADAYYGLWEVNLNTYKKKLLVSPQQQLPGKNNIDRKAKLFNDLAVDKRGDIYWTDSSSDFQLQDLVFSSFANPSGRLFKYDRNKNTSTVLLDELFFANGVIISPKEDFLVVAETGAMRLLKYHLTGVKAGQSEVFVDGLPGLPDNITPDEEGIWVPLVMAGDSEHPNGFSMFSNFPSLRLFFARFVTLLELPFRFIDNLYPNKITQRFVHFIGHGESILLLAPRRATVVRLDWNGNIIGSLHGFDKSVGAVSHVLQLNDHLLFGSPFNRFMGRIKSPIARPVKIKNVRSEGLEATVSSSTVKPVTKTTTTTTTTTTSTTTTTTPKPTTTTTRAAPTTTRTTTTTPRPTTTSTTTTRAPTTTAKPSAKPTQATPTKRPAPVEENIPVDTKPPKQEKLKVINKQGAHVEL